MLQKLKDYSEILSFFILEVLAFVSFTLGNSLLIYFLFGILAFLFVLILNFSKIKELDWMRYLLFLIPFIIFAILSGFSRFNLINNSLLTNFLVCFSLLLFLTLGFLSQTIEGFKLSTAMLVIYGGIAILVSISLIYTMIRYVPFYPLIYAGKYYYYEGERVLIGESVKMLVGFSFADIKIEYFQLFANLLFTSIVGLKFISYKKETKKFIIYCLYALIGFLSMIFTMNKLTILLDILVILSLLFILFIPKKRKILMPIFYCMVSVIGVGFIIFFLNAQSSWEATQGLRNLISSNAILNKLFNANRISAPIIQTLNGCLNGLNLFGFNYAISQIGVSNNPLTSSLPANSWLFDTILYNGFFAAVCLIVFVVFVFKQAIKYFNSEHDDILTRHCVVSFILIFFVFGLFGLSSQPYQHFSNLIPLQQNAMFLIVLFLVGRICFVNFKSVQNDISDKQNEIVEENVNG